MVRKIVKKFTIKTLLPAFLVILVLIATGYVWIRDKSPAQISPPTSGLSPAEKNNTKSPIQGSATTGTNGVSDNPAASSTTPQNGDSPSNGVITLSQPVENEKLTSGMLVSGSAKVNEVQYRIKDNVKGVIAQGALTVVDGKFGGRLSLHPYGTSGTFEVFDFNPDSGREENHIKLDVSF